MTENFVKVKCEKCKNDQVIFTKAASNVDCLVCGEILAESTGGKINLKTKSFHPVK